MGIAKIHRGTVVKGKYRPNDPTAFKLAFAKLEGQEVEVIVRKPKKHGSNNQRRYYFGVIVAMIAEEIGESRENTHDALKAKFLWDMSGEIPKVRSTTDLTTIETEEYYSQIRQWASEFLNVYIPKPNEVDY